jgi:hypothetical protein
MNDSFAAVTWRTGLQPLSGWPLRPLCSAVGVLEQVVPQLQELVSRLPPTFFQPLVSLQGLQVRHVQYRTEQHSTVQYVTVQGVPQQAVHSRAAVKVSTCSTPPSTVQYVMVQGGPQQAVGVPFAHMGHRLVIVIV